MKIVTPIRRSALCAMFAFVWMSGSARAQVTDDGVIFATAAQLRGGLKKIDNDVFVGPAPAGAGANVIFVRRTGPGQVEVHEKLSDILIAQGGRATLIVGGHVTGATQTAPGEWRGGKISGGKTYHLAPGATIWIPAHVPHLMVVPKGGNFTYFAFKYQASD